MSYGGEELNIREILNKLIAEVNNIDGINKASLSVEFMHVNCEEPDYCININKKHNIDEGLIKNKVEKLISDYEEKYKLKNEGVTLFYRIFFFL